MMIDAGTVTNVEMTDTTKDVKNDDMKKDRKKDNKGDSKDDSKNTEINESSSRGSQWKRRCLFPELISNVDVVRTKHLVLSRNSVRSAAILRRRGQPTFQRLRKLMSCS